MSNIMRAFKTARQQPNHDRPAENPWATAYAAEVLASEGKHEEAALVRQEFGPEPAMTDPLDILIAMEEYAATSD